MKSFKPLIWLALVIILFIIFEFGSFCIGRFLLLQRRASTRGSVSIVCIGDSHTFGVGTSSQYSYPKQVERLLNTNNKNQRFSVVNLGIPGSSTKSQAQEIQSYLKNNNATIVIWLSGRNNGLEIKQWGDTSSYSKIVYRLASLRSFKFLKALFNRILSKDKEQSSNKMFAHDQKYAAYLNFYLSKIGKLCLNKGSKLVLLSYYNSSDDIIRDFADKNNIPYFDFTSDFKSLFRKGKKSNYVSLDMSHLNHLGYKFFAEQLYERLFFQQAYLGIKINPLLEIPGEKDFYSNDRETEEMIQRQKERIAQSEGSSEYPFELIHLGHIYMEIGDNEAAKECYLKALSASNYTDNNTIVSPIINLYLRKGQKDAAKKICDEILFHNPENSIARYYKDWLEENIGYPAEWK